MSFVENQLDIFQKKHKNKQLETHTQGLHYMKIIFAPKFSVRISGNTNALSFDTTTLKLSLGSETHIQFPISAIQEKEFVATQINQNTTIEAMDIPTVPTHTDLVPTTTSDVQKPNIEKSKPTKSRRLGQVSAEEKTPSNELAAEIDMPQGKDLSKFSTNVGPRVRRRSSSDYQRVQSPAVTLLHSDLTHEEIQKILSACQTQKTRKEIVDLFVVLDEKDFQSVNTQKVFFSQLCQKYIWDLVALKLLAPSEIQSNPLLTKRARNQKFSLTRHGRDTLDFANKLITTK